jgi:hypothetical protein
MLTRQVIDTCHPPNTKTQKQYQIYRDRFNVTNTAVLCNSTKKSSFTTNTTLFILIPISHINKTICFKQSWSVPGHPVSLQSGNITMHKMC